MKTMTIIAVLMAITFTLSAQDTSTKKPNYDVKEVFFDTHVTVDGVRINSYNAQKLLPDSRNYILWEKGNNAQQTATALYISALALDLAGIGMVFSSNPQVKNLGYASVSLGTVVTIIGITQTQASKKYWRELLVIR